MPFDPFLLQHTSQHAICQKASNCNCCQLAKDIVNFRETLSKSSLSLSLLNLLCLYTQDMCKELYLNEVLKIIFPKLLKVIKIMAVVIILSEIWSITNTT